MKNSTKILLTLTLTLVATLPILAQGLGAPPATPIDGGLSLLLAAGVVYGIKKSRDLGHSKYDH